MSVIRNNTTFLLLLASALVPFLLAKYQQMHEEERNKESNNGIENAETDVNEHRYSQCRIARLVACRDGNLALVSELLAHKNVDVTVQDKYGQTLLITAIVNGHLDIVCMLLKHKEQGNWRGPPTC